MTSLEHPAAESATEAESSTAVENKVTASIPAITFPLEWHELDKKEVQARVYEQWFKLGGCGAAGFDGFLGVLAEKYGYPYNQFPQEIGFLGHSGYTCGSYCGALGGATLAISLFIPKDNQDDVLKELQAWYTSTVLPIYDGEYDDVPEKFIGLSSSEEIDAVDAVSGATVTSDALKEAVKNALAKVK